jgi:hypothetical protein
MTVRKTTGATLGLVATVTIVIVIIGVAIFYLIKIFGGQRELQNAADAGTLNIAKQALVEPWVEFDFSDQTTGPLDACLALLTETKPNQQQGVDLYTYNRLAGQALLVALNASADQGTTCTGNANLLVSEVQALAGKLRGALNDPSRDNSWVSRFFNLANTNSVRMHNGQAGGTAITYNPQAGTTFNTAYMDAGTASNMILNIVSSTSNNLGGNQDGIIPPYTDYGNNTQFDVNSANNGQPLTTTDNFGNPTSYLKGYVPFNITGISSPICAVPTEPNQLPHGVALAAFRAASPPPASANIPAWIPPNAFQTQSKTLVEKTGAMATTESAAVIGTQQQTPSGTPDRFWVASAHAYQLGMPNGYILVDNRGTIGYPTNNPTQFQMPNTDNVDAQELGSTGIEVRQRANGSAAGFADPQNNGQQNMDAWANYIAQNPPPPQGAPQSQWDSYLNAGPPYTGMYNSDGSAVTNGQQAFNVVNGTTGVQCFESNTVTPTANRACQQEDTPQQAGPGNPNGLAPFNLAYHPNSPTQSSFAAPPLMAIEEAKCEVPTLYGPTPQGSGPSETFPSYWGPTGYRLYPDVAGGHNPVYHQSAPYNPPGFSYDSLPGGGGGAPCSYCDPNNICKITSEADIYRLFSQVASINTQAQADPNELAQVFGSNTGINADTQYLVQVGGTLSPSGPLARDGRSFTQVSATNAPGSGSPVMQVSPQEQVRSFLTQRMREMKPWATQAEIDAIVGSSSTQGVPVPFGKRSIIYVDKTQNNWPFRMVDYNEYFQPMNANGVAGPGYYLISFVSNGSVFGADGTPKADGTTHFFQREYAVFGSGHGDGAVNPPNEFGIHMQLFTQSMGDVACYDTVGFTPASGAYNELGTVFMQQYITDNYALGQQPSGPPTLSGRN